LDAAPAEHSEPRAPGTSARILVVDDDQDVAASLALVLRLHGHAVQTACGGLEALEVAERFRPELVLLDLDMPRLDGYGACRRLRELPWGKELKVVALTGWSQESKRDKTKAAGFDAHWTKPVAAAAVLDFLANRRRRTWNSS
jgi:CheY-like chemotaxis protein